MQDENKPEWAYKEVETYSIGYVSVEISWWIIKNPRMISVNDLEFTLDGDFTIRDLALLITEGSRMIETWNKQFKKGS